ncbi:MAG: signal peptidase II [Patescibacteria group bacterium]|nr:signal peptidase II [Patescibacteria group bacterium]
MLKKPQIIFWGVGLLVFGLSQVLRGLIPNVVYNHQLAFGIGWPSFLIIPTVVIFLAVVIWWFYQNRPVQLAPTIFWGLILGGGLSNLFERIIHSGLVADYWEALGLFTFNLADVSISVGIVGLLICLFYVKA